MWNGLCLCPDRLRYRPRRFWAIEAKICEHRTSTSTKPPFELCREFSYNVRPFCFRLTIVLYDCMQDFEWLDLEWWLWVLSKVERDKLRHVRDTIVTFYILYQLLRFWNSLGLCRVVSFFQSYGDSPGRDTPHKRDVTTRFVAAGTSTSTYFEGGLVDCMQPENWTAQVEESQSLFLTVESMWQGHEG